MKGVQVMSNSFSILIPAYKEGKTIENTFRGIINKFKEKNLDFEIITIIDNEPNDNTLEIAKKNSNQFKEIKIISREGKQGIASAIIAGINASSKNIIIIVMGDTSENPLDLIKMAMKMNEGYDMVFANRFSDKSSFVGYPRKKLIVNRLCNFAVRSLFGINSKDITNAVKAYKSQILKNMNITSKGFEVFAEIPIKAFLSGYKNFTEISSSHHAGEASMSKFSILNEGPRYFKVITSCFLHRKISKD